MEESVCKYLSWRAEEGELIISEASFNAREAFCSPSASITFALACLVASASAAIALSTLSVCQDFLQSLGAKCVPQSSGCKKPGGLRGIGDIAHSRHGVVYLVINHSIKPQ